jgi:4-alpha-glucanotransferase
MKKLIFSVNYEAHWAELLRMEGWSLAVLGNQAVLGNWKKTEAVLLSTVNFRSWSLEINASDITMPLEYKYVIVHKNKFIAWESRGNRFCTSINFENDSAYFHDDGLYFDLPLFRGTGLAIPVFSLRSKESFGVGEFLDLQLMVDWAVATGQRMIQILPVNDTTIKHTVADSYPYNTLSVFALHPIYLRLEAVGIVKDTAKKKFFQQQKKRLNALPKVAYEEVARLKWDYFRLIYEQEKERVISSKGYKKFVSDNTEWLLPYAAFCYLRDLCGTADFNQWKDFRKYDSVKVKALTSDKAHELGFYQFLQYHLHLQFLEAHSYAAKKGVLLKGDIPIGVSPHSVDVWCNPHLFNIDVQAGAPPDDFSDKGQNWGFPTYKWEKMAKDNYSWWQARLKYMVNYLDAYRIDHVLGFFRIWEIPLTAKWGLLGQFNPAMPLTKDSIESYGVAFDKRRSLYPYITEEILLNYFGIQAGDVKENYLFSNESGEFEFKPEFNTQQKIADYFSAKKKRTAKEDLICQGLYRLLCQVLFLPDKRYADTYHPRISYKDNESFKALDKAQKEAYVRLYEEYFYYRHNEFWKQQGLQKLPALLSATSMLSCGEDLGMIPSCVPEVMSELHLFSLEIQRMPKKLGVEFGIPYFAPYTSVCSTSTHDMSPLRLWWTENREKTQRFYNTMLFEQGEAPLYCEPRVVEKIIYQHLQSPAMWVIIPIQDWLALDASLSNVPPADERINVPDNPKNEWCYRMHLYLEDLLEAKDFNAKIKKLIQGERS